MEVEQAQDDPNIFELDCPINLETKTTVAARMSAPWATKHKIQRVDSENATSLKNCDIWIHSPSQLMYGSVTVIAYVFTFINSSQECIRSKILKLKAENWQNNPFKNYRYGIE